MKIKTIFGMGLTCLILLSSNVYATERISEEEITTSQEYITEEITRENAVMLLSETEEPTIVESWDISETEDDNVTATLYSDGTLIISGNGKMKNWTSSNNVNWHEFIDNIMSVTIGKGVTSIGEWAFYKCSNLTSVNIPSSVTSIESSSFSGCSSLISVNIPSSVTSIESWAFYKCSSLISVNIPNSVTSIGSYAFCGCSSLTSVEIPSSVTSIGHYAFEGCSSLMNITVDSSNPKYSSENDILYNKDKTELIMCAGGKTGKVEIPSSVTSIGDEAFYKCSGLTNVNIPSSVTSIGESAFSYCSSLTSVNIPKSVTSIGERVFSSCSSLTSMNIPSSVKSIGSYAFYGCSSLTSVNIPKSVTSIGERVFSSCSSLTSMNIPSSVKSIGNWTFYKCSSLTSVDISEGVTNIGNNAFYECSSLTSVNIPSSVTSIGNEAFYGCSSLTSVNIPEGVTSMGYSAFARCSSLSSVNIPSSVTSIGSWAFSSCSRLTRVEISEGVINIRNNAFYGCSSLTSVNIPKSVTSIGYEAFYKCSSLTSVNIPSSVTSIGSYAFYGCKTIIAVQIGANSEQEIAINLPSLLKRTLDEEDIMYANGVESTLVHCNVSTEDQTITFSTDHLVNRKVEVTINDGALEGLTVVVVPSGTIFYNNTEWTKEDVTATVYIEDGEQITNNDGKNEYTFNQNGEYTFTYADREGNTYSSTAKVDWIDKEVPTITNIEGNFEECIQTTLTINAEDSLSGLATQAYSFDGGENWQESNQKEFNITTENIIVQVKDKAGNITIYEPINVKIGHNYEEIVTEPTCTEGGYTTHTCTKCGDTYKDNQTEALGHKYEEIVTEPTCTEGGYTTHTCTRCGDSYTDNQTEALGHNYGEWIITKEATCTEKGIEERTCSICGEKETIEVAEKGHTEVIDKAVEATCTKTGLTEGKHCSVCGKILIAQQGIQALGHNYGEWIIDKEATTEEEGHKYRVCTRCNDKQEETIAKISEEETIISTTYIVKEKENKKYMTIDINTTAKETLENITCNKEIEIIGKDEEKIENEQTIRTGAIIRTKEDSEEQYIVVVKGDINGNGKIDFLNDVVLLNNYRLNRIKLSTESILAGDINGDDKIDFINDIVKINNYRLNRIDKL